MPTGTARRAAATSPTAPSCRHRTAPTCSPLATCTWTASLRPTTLASTPLPASSASLRAPDASAAARKRSILSPTRRRCTLGRARLPPPHSVHGLSRSRLNSGSLSAPNAASCTAAAACRPAACACARSWRPLPAGDWHASSLKCRRRTPDRARFPPPHRAHELPPCRMDPDGPSAPRRTGCRAAAGRQRQPAPARRAQRSSKKGAFQPEVPPRDGRVRRCRSRSGRSAALIRQPKTWLEDAGWSAPGGGPRPGRARPACTAPTPIFGLKTIKTTTRQ